MKTITLVAATVGLLAVLTSCTTTSERTPKQALVCPQCKSAIGAANLDEKRPYSFALTHGDHQCPGCRGTLRALVSGDGWNHECTICKDKPFQCAIR